MKVPYRPFYNEKILICEKEDSDNYTEKPSDDHRVYIVDLDDVYRTSLYSMKYLIDNEFDHSHPQYEFLKELIYSEDKGNLITALTIINEL